MPILPSCSCVLPNLTCKVPLADGFIIHSPDHEHCDAFGVGEAIFLIKFHYCKR